MAEKRFSCLTEGAVPVPAESNGSADAALPFLSAGAGLLLSGALFRLGSGGLVEPAQNHWRVDFQSGHRMRQRRRIASTTTAARSSLPRDVRATINADRRWADIR
ncbi:MAG: hypothetical protein M3P43_13785 [Actinomycetota bacterium]|nr:hypothetical protein [Actinomycetota bacterium]